MITGVPISAARPTRTEWLLLAWIGGIAVAHAVAPLLDPGRVEFWAYDFQAYWLAGQRLGAGADVYPLTEQSHLGWRGVFLYPPLASLPFVPLGAMPFIPASLMFVAINVVATAVAAWACCSIYRAVSGRAPTRREWLWAVALVLTSGAWAEAIGTGNVTIVLVALVAVAGHGLLSHHPAATGVSVAAATLVKISPGILLPWLAASDRTERRAAWIAVATALGATVLSLAWAPMREAWLAYPAYLLSLASEGSAHPSNMSVASLLQPALGPASTWAGLAGAAVAIGLVTLRARRMSVSGGLLAATAASLLFLPALWRHGLLLLIPGMVALWTAHPGRRPATAALAIAAVTASALTVTHLGLMVATGALVLGLVSRRGDAPSLLRPSPRAERPVADA